MHRRALRAREGFRELRQVAQRAVDAELRRRVEVGGEAALDLFGAILAAPRLADREEELLVLGEAVGDVLLGRALAQRAIRVERELDAAHVGDVLAEREPAVDE